MRSDLNIVANTVDVVSYDVKEITDKVEILNSEMAEQQQKTQYLEVEVGNVKIMAGVALGFSALNSISMFEGGIDFPANGVFRGIISKPRLPGEPSWGLPLFDLRSISTDIQPILDWCNEDYKELDPLTNDTDLYNLEEVSISAEAAYEICNKCRETLKPAFKTLATKINEIESDFETALTNYINKNELTRDDKIDIIVNVDKENNNILFEAEDNINTGLMVFQVYVGNDTKQFRRRVYVKVIDGQIEEYKGVQQNMEVNDPVSGENVSLKLLAHSEEDRVAYFPDIIIEGKTITIESQNEYRIWGVVIEYNSFTRHLTFTPNDLAYTCDIEALDKKINALAEQSHSNDVAMASIQEEYATVNEVNEVLENNYVLKSEFDKLKEENESLKATIAAFESRLSALEKADDPDSEWKEFYAEYSIKFEKESADNVFYADDNEITFMFDEEIENDNKAYLAVFCDNDGKKHFYEYAPARGLGCFDRFYEPSATLNNNDTPRVINPNLNITKFQDVRYDALYKTI